MTGSTGFIGKRLVSLLLNQGHEVYALSRIRGIPLGLEDHPQLKVLYGDLRDVTGMDLWPQDLDAAYYLIHSMGDIVKNLTASEENTARNFLQILEATTYRQIIYLGGIIESHDSLSPHLQSRLSVENILKKGKIPCTILRASIIIGAGSASLEIVRDLVEKIPIMIAPRWVKSLCQPIAAGDVLFYLHGVLLNVACYDQTFDIGGPEVMSFKELMLRYSTFRQLKRYIIDVPVLTPRLSSYWLVFVSSVKFSICFYLVESMKQSTRKLNLAIDSILPHECLKLDEAIELAFQTFTHHEVRSTWMDAWDLQDVNADIQTFRAVPIEGCLKDIQIFPLKAPLDIVKQRLWKLGGNQGWYSMNWAWRLRGLIDQFAGGTGMNRGRRHPSELQIGDSIDFWRVLVADYSIGHLVLFAEMKLPGEAWLEFLIDQKEGVLRQTATFRPKGLSGRFYWYLLFPFHLIIFKNMANALTRES